MRESQSVMEEFATGPMPLEMFTMQLSELFLAGFEFALRFSRRHPDLVDAGIAWCDSAPDDKPLELRERAMQVDAQKMVDGCSS